MEQPKQEPGAEQKILPRQQEYEKLNDSEKKELFTAWDQMKEEQKKLDKGKEELKKEAQIYRLRAFEAQPHFKGMLPGTEDARMLADSRKASESLAKSRDIKAESWQEDKRFEYNKLDNKRNELLKKFSLNELGAYKVGNRLPESEEEEKEEKEKYR